jgi:hypothetical protein
MQPSWAMTLTYVMVCPWEAVSMGRIAAYSFPQIKASKLYQVGGYDVHLPVLLIAFITAAVITFINYRGVHQSTAFQNITTFGLLANAVPEAPVAQRLPVVRIFGDLLQKGRHGHPASTRTAKRTPKRLVNKMPPSPRSRQEGQVAECRGRTA